MSEKRSLLSNGEPRSVQKTWWVLPITLAHRAHVEHTINAGQDPQECVASWPFADFRAKLKISNRDVGAADDASA